MWHKREIPRETEIYVWKGESNSGLNTMGCCTASCSRTLLWVVAMTIWFYLYFSSSKGGLCVKETQDCEYLNNRNHPVCASNGFGSFCGRCETYPFNPPRNPDDPCRGPGGYALLSYIDKAECFCNMYEGYTIDSLDDPPKYLGSVCLNFPKGCAEEELQRWERVAMIGMIMTCLIYLTFTFLQCRNRKQRYNDNVAKM